jgi:hypothetical protein
MFSEITKIVEVLNNNLGLKTAKEIIAEVEILSQEWINKFLDELNELEGSSGGQTVKRTIEKKITETDKPSSKQTNDEDALNSVLADILGDTFSEINDTIEETQNEFKKLVNRLPELVKIIENKIAPFEREITKSLDKMLFRIAQQIASNYEVFKEIDELREAISKKGIVEDLENEIKKIQENTTKLRRILPQIEEIVGKTFDASLKGTIVGPLGALLRFWAYLKAAKRFGQRTTKDEKEALEKFKPETEAEQWDKIEWGLEGQISIEKGGIKLGDLELLTAILNYLLKSKNIETVKEINELLIEVNKEVETIKKIITTLNLQVEVTINLVGQIEGKTVEVVNLVTSTRNLLEVFKKSKNESVELITGIITKHIIDTLAQKKQNGIAIQEYSPEEIKLITESIGQKVAGFIEKVKETGKGVVLAMKKIIESIKKIYGKILAIRNKMNRLISNLSYMEAQLYKINDEIIYTIAPLILRIAQITENIINEAAKEMQQNRKN